MIKYVIRRIPQLFLILLGASLLAFLLIHISGDPVRALLPLDASDQDVARIRATWGLDQPLPIQYVVFLREAVTGNLGQSFRYRRDALSLVLGRIPATFTLAVASIILAFIVSTPLGILASARPGGVADAFISFLSSLCIAVPSFWLGLVLILIFADALHWLPAAGRGGWKSMVLPTVTMSAFSIGLITRLVRASMLEELRQAYVTSARAKGLSEIVVYSRHALRNALVPVVTLIGLQFGQFVGGSMVVETVFAWPGTGWLMIQAIYARDMPLIRAVVLIMAAFFVLINLVVDIVYAYLDPRISYE
jgi:ABC-type dipeptide/oligopeptide/nickel transport system permease component